MITRRLEAMYLAGGVKRCHTIPTLFNRTIAEHVYGAQMVAVELCRLNGVEPGKVLEAVLYHDAPEVETGDLPANVKKHSQKLREGLEDMEANFLLNLHMDFPPLSELEQLIVKAADNLDFLFMCLNERRMGNRHPYLNVVYNRSTSYAVTLMEKLNGTREVVMYIAQEWGNVGKFTSAKEWHGVNVSG